MKQAPLWIRFLHFCGLMPQKVLLAFFDLLALVLTAVAVFLLRHAFGGTDPVLYQWVLPLLLAGPVLAAGMGLYPSVSLPPHREIKSLFQLASLIYGLILVALFLAQTGDAYSRLVIVGGWAATVCTLPLMRSLCRRLFARQPWWGRSVLIFDNGRDGRKLWRHLRNRPEKGLNPVDILPLPATAGEIQALFAAQACRHPGVIAVLVQRGESRSLDIVTEASRFFESTLVVPVLESGFRVQWVSPRDLGQVSAHLVRQNLRDGRRLGIKRFLDLLLCALGAVVLVPCGLLLALVIKLDSPGPVFYRQKRIGRGGREIRIFKFRTMVQSADKVLRDVLANDAALRAEWEKDQKLRRDPRITRVGRIVRKLSLDELPQLINVLLGDMSLVGPRPIVASEVGKYGSFFEEYCLVRPGITGLWQVSGRNNTTYAERVAFDHYYINNWSVWMDIWILARTLPVAITGYGAY